MLDEGEGLGVEVGVGEEDSSGLGPWREMVIFLVNS